MRVVVILAHRQQRNVETDDDARGEEVAGGFPEQHIRREFPQRRIAHRDDEHAQAADYGQHRAHDGTVLRELILRRRRRR